MLWLIDSCQNRVFADQYHMTSPRAQVSTHRGRSSRSYPLTNYQFQMIAGSSLFFLMIHMKYVVFMSLWPRTIEISISNWARTRKFSQFFWKYRRGRPFRTMVTRWSRSTSIFYALIGQNLTSELMWKIYAASWKLFTLTVEADGVLCQLVMFLTAFFDWIYKMKYSCYQESSVIHCWFVYSSFGWEMRRLSNFGNPISDGIVFVFTLLNA